MNIKPVPLFALAFALSVLLINHARAEAPFSFEHLYGGHFTKSETVSMADIKKYPLLLFWRSDCAPCLIEIGMLPDIVKDNPDLKIALVALQDKNAARKHLPKNLPQNVAVMITNGDGRSVLKEFGDDGASLPYSVMLHKDGEVCDKNNGIIGAGKVNKWVKTC